MGMPPVVAEVFFFIGCCIKIYSDTVVLLFLIRNNFLFLTDGTDTETCSIPAGSVARAAH